MTVRRRSRLRPSLLRPPRRVPRTRSPGEGGRPLDRPLRWPGAVPRRGVRADRTQPRVRRGQASHLGWRSQDTPAARTTAAQGQGQAANGTSWHTGMIADPEAANRSWSAGRSAPSRDTHALQGELSGHQWGSLLALDTDPPEERNVAHTLDAARPDRHRSSRSWRTTWLLREVRASARVSERQRGEPGVLCRRHDER